MILLEHEAKYILHKASIPIPASFLVSSNETTNLTFPLILKSQVPTGGRGKAGGVRIVKDQEEYDRVASELFTLPIRSFLPKHLLAEEVLDIDRELYVAIMINRDDECINIMAHTNGGIEVESNMEDGYWKMAIRDKTSFDTVGENLAEYYDLPGQTFALQDLLEHLYGCFTTNDATLIEINPLILTKEGNLIAGDCKMTLDDAATFRHQDWQFENMPTGNNFVTLDVGGSVATIANGAGLAMATVDAVAARGLVPANFLDIGGGANSESVLTAFRKIMEFRDVKAIVINIFAGITRCDEVARAIIAARKQIDNLPPLAIRLAGTNIDIAKELLAAEAIPLLPTLEECLMAAETEVHRG